MSNLNEEDIAKWQDDNSDTWRVEEIESIEYDENGNETDTWNGYAVVLSEKPSKHCFDCRNRINADMLCDFLNKYCSDVIGDKTIDEYFEDWDNLLVEISTKTTQLYMLKERIFDKEQEIINNTDFKELYGKNNADVRKNHLKQEMQADYDAKNDLEMDIDAAKRRITYIRSMLDMQRALVDSGVIE